MQSGVVNGPGQSHNLGTEPRELMQLSAIHMYDPLNPTKYKSEGVLYEHMAFGGVILNTKEMEKICRRKATKRNWQKFGT